MAPAHWLVVAALCVSGADLLQVLFLGKGAGAVGGLVVYTAVAATVTRWRLVAVVPLVVVVIPTVILADLSGSAARASLVDAPMWGVYAVQLVCAVLGIEVLFGGSAHGTGEMR